MKIFHPAGFGICLVIVLASGCQKSPQAAKLNASESNVYFKIENAKVEAACGQCQFDMEGTDCDLAIRFAGKTYFVDGSSVDDHGDAHANDGLCNCIREAVVSGKTKDGRFIATKFELVPLE